MQKTVKHALKVTLPVLFGYLVLGTAFGLLIQKAGYSFLWATVISIVVYAGSMQFVLVGFLENGLNLISVALTTLSVNSRHIFYGLTFIEKFKKMGKLQPYMIFSLTDETYSLLFSVKTPEGMNEKHLWFLIALFDHCYWILGCTIGALLGQVIPINTQGVEFSMTALFVVIFIDQWRERGNRLPAILGFASAVLCMILLGPDRFLLPSLLITVVLLLVLRAPIERNFTEVEVTDNAN